MALQTGTLIGATIRINDDQDLYPAAVQQEIKGGHHKRTFYADLATFPAHLKEAGMLCFVAADGNTYQLSNDLTTWTIFVTPAAAGSGGGGTVAPGTGGATTTATIISGNFGEWLPLPTQNASIFDKQIDLQYKADLSAFPTRATVFITGQFGLAAAFLGTVITLGKLPATARPKAKLKKWMACKGVELYLVIETNGDVKLQSKDGFNLPVATAATENDPFFIETFFNPDITTVAPTVYPFTRTENFTRNNCGTGQTGTVVSFSKTYNSNVSIADAQNIALADSSYLTLGQANSNANGSCSVDPIITSPALILTGYYVNGENSKFIFTASISEALANNLVIDFGYTFFDNGGADASLGQITILAGQLTSGDIAVNYTDTTITGLVVTINNAQPNPNGGKTITY